MWSPRKLWFWPTLFTFITDTPYNLVLKHHLCYQTRWPCGRRRRSAAARLLRMWVRIPLGGAWMSVSCECCVLSGRGICDELITRPEEPYRMWCAVVCDLETSWMRRLWSTGGCRAKREKDIVVSFRMSLFIFLDSEREDKRFCTNDTKNYLNLICS